MPRRRDTNTRRTGSTGLEEYRRKRDFAVTPEPPPSFRAKRRGPPRFMVHKHAARRLHYDLRLEMEGALASWAIPRGPSFDPKEKRLAVRTEDHPLEYGDFEGRIPEGEYGAGDSLIWDHGTWETEPPGQASAMREKGHLRFRLSGEKLRGVWHLVRTRVSRGREQWMLFKAKDEEAREDYDVVAQRPESVRSGRRIARPPTRVSALRATHPPALQLLMKIWPPMRAVLGTPELVRPDRHLLEVKYDGFRALAGVSGGEVSLQSRNGLDLSQRFAGIARALQTLPIGEAVLDGEIVALDAKGEARFEELQTSGPDQRYVAFDLLWLDGEDLRTRPLEERRELLESVLANQPLPLQASEMLQGELVEILATLRRRRLEGLMAKRRGSPYANRRSRDWLKVKIAQSQEVVIVGYTPIKTGASVMGALLVAVREGRGYRYAGRVGTGFTDAMRRELWHLLEEDRTAKPTATEAPRRKTARWVRPRHVAEVAFTEWTRDGKLRQPSFKGLRPDKSPGECVREEPVTR